MERRKPPMLLDAAIALIIILSTVFGFRSGFVESFLHLVGWVLSVVIAFAFAPKLNEFLRNSTGFYDSMLAGLSERFGGGDGAGVDDVSRSLPDIFRNTVDSLSAQMADNAAVLVADLLFAVTAFLMIIFAIKAVFFVLIALLSKRNNPGFRGFVDGVLGLISGLVRGVFIVFVFLAAIIPLVGLVDAGFVEILNASLDSSYLAGTLYDNNFLALIVRDFLVK